MVTAPAKGIFWRVIKNKVKAVTPKIPLARRIFLLLPSTETDFFFKAIKLSTKETKDLKNTNSKTGIWGRAFTHRCIKENANEEIIIYCAPLFIANNLRKDKESIEGNYSPQALQSFMSSNYFILAKMKGKQKYQSHETAVIDKNCKIGDETKIWHFSHIMSGAIIGAKCKIGQNVVISPEVILGDNVKVQNNVSIYTGVICEDNVFLGPSCVFTNVNNPRSIVNRRGDYEKTFVKKGATIGANATIVCGITIGEFAFIGAGAVVTKDVAAYALVVGNPSRQIGWISEYGNRLELSLIHI